MVTQLVEGVFWVFVLSHRWEIVAVVVLVGLAYLLNKRGKR